MGLPQWFAVPVSCPARKENMREETVSVDMASDEGGGSDGEPEKNEWLDRIVNFLATYLP
jgi:hypothetical protein